MAEEFRPCTKQEWEKIWPTHTHTIDDGFGIRRTLVDGVFVPRVKEACPAEGFVIAYCQTGTVDLAGNLLTRKIKGNVVVEWPVLSR